MGLKAIQVFDKSISDIVDIYFWKLVQLYLQISTLENEKSCLCDCLIVLSPCCAQARLMRVHTASILSKLFSALFSARTNRGKNIIFLEQQLYDPWQGWATLKQHSTTDLLLTSQCKIFWSKIKWFCYSWYCTCLPLKLYRINISQCGEVQIRWVWNI